METWLLQLVECNRGERGWLSLWNVCHTRGCWEASTSCWSSCPPWSSVSPWAQSSWEWRRCVAVPTPATRWKKNGLEPRKAQPNCASPSHFKDLSHSGWVTKAAQKFSNVQNPPRLADLCKYYLFFFISFQSVDDPEVIKPLLVEATAEPEAWITTQRFTSLL